MSVRVPLPEVTVKLTAPPPPPPEPQSGQSTPHEPATPSVPPEGQTTSPPIAAKNVVWPTWFLGADYLLVLGVLALAYLLGSFVARNPDLWLHLAAGKRLLAGEYRPGTDPFSYSAADRTWVNHSILFDASAYLIYGGSGVLLVAVKALIIVLTFGLLIGIRRPGFSLWPWAAVAGIAALCAAPRMSLSPLVGSMFLLAVTLFLLFRFPRQPGSWRLPIAIGITFWIWAQVDSWFFLGPLVLLLMILGELIQSLVFKPDSTGDQSNPLGSRPEVPTLVKALGIGVLACMLNPHHVRIWELPFELIGADGIESDKRISSLTFSPIFDKIYLQSASWGMNFNGLAYMVLLLGGTALLIASLGFGVGKLRFSHVALWAGFALLSIKSVFAIPFFAIVAVPLIASQLNAYSSLARLTSWVDPKTRLLLLGSAVGRVLCLILVASACLFTWPGWMQPESYNPAFTRRVGWGIEPDPGLVRAAQELQSWRETGLLGSDKHGFIASIELADYCAWFAPLEKVYINGYFDHHRTELPVYIGIRNALGFSRKETQSANETGKMLAQLKADYLVLASSQNEVPGLRNFPVVLSTELWMDPYHWAPWYFDGRSAITGWQSSETMQKDFEALRMNPVELAFGPRVERLQATSVKEIPPVEVWADEFIHGIEISPPGVEEAIGWQLLKDMYQKQYMYEEWFSDRWTTFTPAPSGFTSHSLAMRLLGNRRRPSPAVMDAVPFLSLRAARRAIFDDPNNPDTYYALYIALKNQELPISETERSIGQVTALRQCLLRMPPPKQFRRNIYLVSPHEVARLLSLHYYGQPPQRGLPNVGLPVDLPALSILSESSFSDVVGGIAEENGRVLPIRWRDRNQFQRAVKPNVRAIDLSREMLLLAIDYAEAELIDENREILEKELESMKQFAKRTGEELVKRTQAFESEKLRLLKLPDQVRSAMRHDLVGKALEMLVDKGTDLQKEYMQGVVDIMLIRIALEMILGRLEDVAFDLKYAPGVLDSMRLQQNVRLSMQNQLQNMTYEKLIFEGNYREAGDLVGSMTGDHIGQEPPLSPQEAAFKPSPGLVSFGIDRTYQAFQFIPVNTFAQLHRNSMLLELIQPFYQRQQNLLRTRNQSSGYYYQRGLLALFEGDIPSAKKRFEQSRQKGVPEWGVPDVTNPKAEQYLKLINQANADAARKSSQP